MKPFIRRSLVLLSACLALAAPAQTITTWNTTTGDLATTGNWTAGLPSWDNSTFETHVGIISNGGTATVTTALTYPSAMIDSLRVGGTTNSTLEVQSSGSLDAVSLYLGYGAGSTGTATVAGAVRTLLGVTVGQNGTGTMNISNGGSVAGSVFVAGNAGSTGSLTLNSGAALVNDEDFGDGNLSGGDGNATITLYGGSSVAGAISVGGAGTTTLTITGGSVTVGGNIALGATSGTVNAHLDGASLSPSGLLLNGYGTNSLLVNNGSTLTMTNLVVSEIGASGSGSNTMTVSGSGTSWTNDGQIRIGGPGTGTLNVTDAAYVSQQQVTVGESSGGSGTLNVTTGAAFMTGNLLIGLNSGSTGHVTVDGAETSLHVASDFRIGSAGTGTLMVSGHGTLANDGEAAIGITGSGSVTVTGSGSNWTSGGNITLGGGGGTGSITLANDGQLAINGGGHLYLSTAANGSGTLNIGAGASSAAADPGFLTATDISGNTSGGSAVVVFNHTSSALFFDTPIINGVRVVQKHGTTILTGANSYSGGNLISGGTLALGGDNAIGSGNLTLAGGTLGLNDFAQTSGTLTLSGNSYIDFTATSSLILADSSALAWSGSLTLLNFDGSDSFRVGTTAGGLTGLQLALINIDGFIATIDASGYLSASTTAFTAVPEPSTYAALAGAAALGLAVLRRRRPAITITQQL